MDNTIPQTPSYEGWKRRIALFFVSQTVSLFGSSLVQFAIIWYITLTTDSGWMLTLSTACGFLPQVLVSLFAGVWADRYNRKTLIIIADSSIAVSTLILAVLMALGVESFALILVVSAVRSFGSGVQMPCVSAIIPQIVPPSELMRINSLNGSVNSIVNLVAPAVAGAVLSWGAFHNILLIDVVTAAIGVGIFAFIKVGRHKGALERAQTRVFADLKDGLQYAWRHTFIKKLLVMYAVFSILVVTPAMLNVLFVSREFGDNYWNLTLNEIVFFVGSALGGVALAAWGGFKNRVATLSLSIILFGALTIAVGFTYIFWVYLLVMFVTGLTLPMANSPIMVLIQEKVEEDRQGRMFSLLQIVSSLLVPVGMAVFGPLADIMSIRTLMIVTGVGLAVLGVAVLLNPSFMREGLPQASPEKTTINE